MKIEVDDLDKTYNNCISNGIMREKNVVDIELIKSLRNMAEMGLKFIKKNSISASK